jgi:tetratricopeptide (TPR) repeat protein
MKPLEPPDTDHLGAARGWLDLGNHLEATEELEKIAPRFRSHPDVLQVSWLVCSKAENWPRCLEIATTLTKLVPERRFGWLHRAVSLDKLQRTTEAWFVIIEAVNRFGPSSTFAFHLACFCARLGKTDEAAKFVARAIELSEDQETLERLRQRIVDEPLLASIWKAEGGG